MKGIAATSWSPDRIDIFYLRPDFSMGHNGFTGAPFPGTSVLSNAALEQLGGSFISAPVAVMAYARPRPEVLAAPSATTGSPSASTGTPTPQPASGTPAIASHEATFVSGPTTSTPAQPSGVTSARLTAVGTQLLEKPRIDVFGIGSDSAMWYLELWNGVAPSSKPQWTSLGGSFMSTPAAVAWNSGRVDVFAVGTDRAMYHKSYNGQSWSSEWERLGGIFTSEASVVSWGPNRLDIFAIASDYTLRHRSYDGTNWLNDWQNLGGNQPSTAGGFLASPPSVISWGPNRLDVFAVFNDGTLGHTWWDGMIWNSFEYLALPGTNKAYVGTPSAVTWGQNRMDIFVSGNDGNLYHYWWSGEAFQGPESLGCFATPPSTPAFTPSPTAISVVPNRLDVFCPANQNDHEGNIASPILGHRTWDGTTWRPWAGVDEGQMALPTRYRFSVDYVTVETARSLNQDTDTAQASVSEGNWPAQTATQFMGNVGGTAPKQAQTNLLNFGPVTVELCESVVFNYQILNKVADDQNTLDQAMNKADTALAQQAINSIKSQLSQGVSQITGVTIGSITGVPVLGTILGLVGGWLIGQLTNIAFADCDGIVAVEQAVLMGKDLHAKTASGTYSVTTEHPGTDSNTGCGANSKYRVQWSIRRV